MSECQAMQARAATIIQTYFRGYLARKIYSQKLLRFFEEEEERRREKEQVQMLEGELLLERHHLCHQIADNKTLSQNEERLMNLMATRIQQAWKKYKGNNAINSHGQGRTHICARSQLQLHSINTGDSKELNGQQFMTRAHDSGPVDNGRTDCHMYTEPDAHDHDNESDNSPYIPKVEQLASQVRSALSEDGSAELEMFETPVDLPFEGQSAGIRFEEALNVKTCDDQIALPVGPVCMSQKKAEHPQVTNTAVSEVKEQLDNSQSAELTKDLGTLGSHHTQDSSVKWLESAFRASTSHDHLPTSMQILDEKTIRLDKEGATSPEDRYRLCYTIELSDSSSEEDKNKSSHEYEDHNFPNSTESNQEANDRHRYGDYMALYMVDNDEHRVEQSLSYSTDFEDFNKDSNQHLIEQHVGVAQAQKCQQKHLDHSTSPLFTMNLQQLRQLFLSLKQELNSNSTILIQLLKERDSLSNENRLLKMNIAQLARRVQSLYVPP